MNYQGTNGNIAIVVISPIVVDIGKTTIVGVTANQPVIAPKVGICFLSHFTKKELSFFFCILFDLVENQILKPNT